MYLFDTDVVIELLRDRSKVVLRERIASVPPYEQHLSSVSLSELVYGACRSQRPEYHLRQIRTILLQHVQIVDFDSNAAWRAGALRATLVERGCPIDFPDLQIASIALARDLILVTGNDRHFTRVPDLRVENWLA